MSISVFIAPGSSEQINRNLKVQVSQDIDKLTSLEGLITIEAVSDVLAAEERNRLKQLYPDKKIRMWGTRIGQKSIWDQMKENDYVFFYRFSAGDKYFYQAEVCYKTSNSALAEKVWGKYRTVESWELVFFLRNVRALNISRGDFNRIAGYKDNFRPRGFIKVKDQNAANRIIQHITLRSQSARAHFDLASPILFDLLTSKKQIILYGPPGTGKTYQVQRLAVAFLGQQRRV